MCIFDNSNHPNFYWCVSINVGVSTLGHTYVSGGRAQLDVDRPYDGQVIYFDQLYKGIIKKTIKIRIISF